MRALQRLILGFIVLAFSHAASAQYPAKPVRMIVPFPPGGGADNTARIVATHLARTLGQPVVVDNRAGADGAIATEAVIKSPADGYTLLFGTSSPIIYVPLQRKNAPYDPLSALMPVSLVGHFSVFLFVHSDVPARSLAEFVSYARANPGRVNNGVGHMTAILTSAKLAKQAGLQMTNLPYKGDAPVLPDLVAGRVHFMVTVTPATALVHAKEGRVRPLATILDRRAAIAPEVPTTAEAGFPSVTVPSWAAIFGPAELPADVRERLSAAINHILRDAGVRDTLGKQGFQAAGSTSEELRARIAGDLKETRAALRDAGIQPE
jgi:tripartite-type tricarboxylate transporter receptor subunit TctC